MDAVGPAPTDPLVGLHVRWLAAHAEGRDEAQQFEGGFPGPRGWTGSRRNAWCRRRRRIARAGGARPAASANANKVPLLSQGSPAERRLTSTAAHCRSRWGKAMACLMRPASSWYRRGRSGRCPRAGRARRRGVTGPQGHRVIAEGGKVFPAWQEASRPAMAAQRLRTPMPSWRGGGSRAAGHVGATTQGRLDLALEGGALGFHGHAALAARIGGVHALNLTGIRSGSIVG